MPRAKYKSGKEAFTAKSECDEYLTQIGGKRCSYLGAHKGNQPRLTKYERKSKCGNNADTDVATKQSKTVNFQ